MNALEVFKERRPKIVPWIAAVWFAALVSLSAQTIPDVVLTVTVQQREDGKLNPALHVMDFACFNGQCSLTTVTLNQCYTSGDGRTAFVPKIERASTAEKTLAVRRDGHVLIVHETSPTFGGDTTASYRFDYAPVAAGRTATQLVGFSGGFVKDSTILKRVVTIDYVPLPESYQVIGLDCGVLAPGLQKKP
jgi:hypothetical protein